MIQGAEQKIKDEYYKELYPLVKDFNKNMKYFE